MYNDLQTAAEDFGSGISRDKSTEMKTVRIPEASIYTEQDILVLPAGTQLKTKVLGPYCFITYFL